MIEEKSYYQLKIQAKEIRPSIYRTILVDSKINFQKLHDYIQNLFNLENYHLWNFTLEKKDPFGIGMTRSRRIGPKIEGEWDRPDFYADKKSLCDILTEEKQKILYWYDFGDDWKLNITLQKIIPKDKLNPKINKIPLLIKAQGPMLLEDCGGNWGFDNIIYFYHKLKNKEPLAPKEKEFFEKNIAYSVVDASEKNWQKDFIKIIDELYSNDWDAFEF